MINTDSYYEIGDGHVFCEDYADSGVIEIGDNKYHYAIVCDGCSASEGSDFGARWYAKYFPKALILALSRSAVDINTPAFADVIRDLLVKSTFEAETILKLSPECFDATVVATVYSEKEDTLYTYAWGDGVILYKNKQGDPLVTDISYVKNAPYYISYKRNPELDAEYEKHFGEMYADFVSFIVKENELVHATELDEHKQKFFFEVYKNARTNIESISVFTDGIHTYHLKGQSDVLMPMHNVYNQLTQYKTFHGEFVKRRMQAVKKFCEKEGWCHFDDVSVATITLK